MDEAGTAAVVPGPSQPAFCRPGGPERRTRKSGSANIFQGVNLRQLRRLFHSAGEPDAERRARQVWGGEGEDDGDELAQALVGLRVRARTRSGIRAEAGRVVRPLGNSRMNDRTSLDTGSDEDGASTDPPKTKLPHDQADEEEEDRRTPRKDADRYLHRIRH